MVETTLKTLIERFRSKPEWQHADPAVRADAVLRLPSSEREILLALAHEDADPRVRRAAVKKLPDVAVLAQIAASDTDTLVRDEAEGRLAHIASHEHDEALAREALRGLREPKHLAAVAKAAPLALTREAAVFALTDAKFLAAVVRESEDTHTRLAALARIEDGPTLLALALKVEQKAVAVAAVERLADPDALRAVADKARAGAASRRARARLETGEPAGPSPVAAPQPLEQDDEAERQAYEEARAAHEREAAARALATEARAALLAPLEGASGEAIPAALERARADHGALPPLAGSETLAFEVLYEAALAAAEKRHEAYLAGLARREELLALVEQAEALAGQELGAARAGFPALEAKWREATSAADLPELRARFEAAGRALRERGRAVREETAQKDQQHLDQLLRLADRAEALVGRGADVSLRDADHALREIREALDHPGHFPTRKDRDAALARLDAARKHLYPLLQQLREDAEWKRWVNTTVQEELCAQAEALLEEQDLEKAANALRELDARWKQAKEAPKDQAEALWTRFKAAREQVKSRTDAFFAKQAEELAGNLKKKEALCEKAAGLAESSDWLKTAEELRKLQAEWKEIGPVPRAVSQRVWERFRKPCDHFFTRWQEHRNVRSHEWADNLAKKEALCEKAEALRDSAEWDAASAELKRLQAEWRTIGAVKKTRSEAIWQRFRAACDHFFDRYKNRDEHARQAAQDAREAICAELESLLPPDGETPEPPADLVARLQAAQTAWRQAGSLPQDQLAALDERFSKARDGLLQAFPRAFEGTDLDPEASRRKAEKLVLRTEALLAEMAPGGGVPQPQNAQELAARLRDALASNTIGGREAVEAKWHSASVEIEAAQAAWKRLGPVPGRGGPRPFTPLRARVSPLLRAASEAEAGAAARRLFAARGRAWPSLPLRPARPARSALAGGSPCRRVGSPRATSSSCSSSPRPPRPTPRPSWPPSAARGCWSPSRAAGARPARGGSASSAPTSARSPSSRAGRGPGRLPAGGELRDLGRDLFEVLFPGDVRRLYDSARGLRGQGALPVVFTSMLDWVADKPWELAFDPSRREFLSTSSVNFVRNAFTAVPADAPARRRGRLRILVVVAQPRGAAPLDSKTETSDLRQAFASLVDDGRATIEILPRATAGRLQRRLAAGGIDVLHYVGHGGYDARAREGSLLLEDERGRECPLGAEALRQVVCRRGLRLVFLNACESGRGGRVEWNRGVAPALVAAGVPAVVANQYAVEDAAATAFARELYAQLATGSALGDAAREARVAVGREQGTSALGWAVPVVFARDPREPLR